jgi:hypothetical protein
MDVDQEMDMKQIPPSYWDKIMDQPSKTRIGLSFLDNKRNQFAVCKQ